MPQKICIVTGANSGIGKATVEGVARQGMTVVLACRDTAKGEAAIAEIRAKVPSADLHCMSLDLASLESIRKFAVAFAAKFGRLDVLVENAGISTGKRQTTKDGFEMDFGTNHLGHFLLTQLLVPTLKASAPSRVVVVSSSVHKGAKLDFADLQGEREWRSWARYCTSKLANMLFMREQARRLEGTGVVINALHPGVISTELARDFPAPLRLMARLFFKSPAQGAKTSIFLATAPEMATVSGKYFAGSKEAKPGAEALDDEAARKLWAESERMTGVSAPSHPKAASAAS
jgi:NAD(P)-dependent dehydrogenase (short-subunit alcohol dehydrogenase family)